MLYLVLSFLLIPASRAYPNGLQIPCGVVIPSASEHGPSRGIQNDYKLVFFETREGQTDTTPSIPQQGKAYSVRLSPEGTYDGFAIQTGGATVRLPAEDSCVASCDSGSGQVFKHRSKGCNMEFDFLYEGDSINFEFSVVESRTRYTHCFYTHTADTGGETTCDQVPSGGETPGGQNQGSSSSESHAAASSESHSDSDSSSGD